MPLSFPLDNQSKGTIENTTFNNLKALKLYAGLPVFTATPTYTGFEGEMVWLNDGTHYSLYAYINKGWRQIGTTDLTDSGATTLHSHAAPDHGALAGLDDDDHGAVYPNLGATETIIGAWDFSNAACEIGAIVASDLVGKDNTESISGQWGFPSYFPNGPTSGDPPNYYSLVHKRFVEETAAYVPRALASDTLIFSADTERFHGSGTYTKKKEIRVDYGGVVRVKFEIRGSGGSGVGRIYVNGVAVGAERIATTYEEFSEDISGLGIEDLVQLYTKTGTGSTVYCKNFRIYFDTTLQQGEVITD